MGGMAARIERTVSPESGKLKKKRIAVQMNKTASSIFLSLFLLDRVESL